MLTWIAAAAAVLNRSIVVTKATFEMSLTVEERLSIHVIHIFFEVAKHLNWIFLLA